MNADDVVPTKNTYNTNIILYCSTNIVRENEFASKSCIIFPMVKITPREYHVIQRVLDLYGRRGGDVRARDAIVTLYLSFVIVRVGTH